MTGHSTEHSHDEPNSSRGGPRRWVFWGFILVAAFFLLTEHRAHTFQYLPFILVLACPLMHLFHGHGGHGGHGSRKRPDENGPGADKPASEKKHGSGCH